MCIDINELIDEIKFDRNIVYECNAFATCDVCPLAKAILQNNVMLDFNIRDVIYELTIKYGNDLNTTGCHGLAEWYNKEVTRKKLEVWKAL